METITWKNSDLTGKRFDFESSTQPIGTLTVSNELGADALFTTDNDRLQFSRAGFWDNKILIKKNGQLIGEIKNQLFGATHLKLKSGTTFRLSSNLIGRNLKWLSAKGHPTVEYKMATLTSMGKGFIKVDDSLSSNDKEILLSAGLIAGRFNAYRLLFGLLGVAALLYLLGKIFGL